MQVTMLAAPLHLNGVLLKRVPIKIQYIGDRQKFVIRNPSPPKARVDTASGAITVLVPLDEADAETLASCVKTPEAKAKVAEAVQLVREVEKAFGGSGKPRQPSPYERQMDFIVPLLCVREDGVIFEFESTFLLEHPWKLSAKDAALAANYNPLQRPAGKAGLVDIGTKGEVQTQVL